MKTVWKENSTGWNSFDDDPNFNVYLRILFVLTGCIAGAFGNFLLLLVFYLSSEKDEIKRKRSYRVVDIILASLGMVGFIRGVILGPLQTICLISGRWIFGPTACQVQAYLEAMLRNIVPWCLALLGIERYTLHMAPYEYLATFSPLTINIVLLGILLVVAVQVTAPLYGWGTYGYLPETGLCSLQLESKLVCSYGLYLIGTLTVPPFVVIIVMSTVMGLSNKNKLLPDDNIRRNLPAGCSRLLDIQREIPSLLVLMILFTIFAVPRYIMDTALMCNSLKSTLSPHTFLVSFLDNLTNLLLPNICLSCHQTYRFLVYGLFDKRLNRVKNEDNTSGSNPL